ncbi:MAG: hypothetical protein ABS95_01770 [Verrucomicrobia bacterium SCN 57-15]|nr:MAG: hypothetical protein ABS95_01770 [Verrucomicrobia bacterium SCN 57-15]
MSKSNYLETKVLDAALGGQAFPSNANVYISLHTADPGEAGAGAEVTGGSYARKAVANDLTQWPSANPKVNANVITFVTPTAGWGVVTHFGIWDAPTGGNLLFSGALTASKTINSGDPVTFAAGAISITED